MPLVPNFRWGRSLRLNAHHLGREKGSERRETEKREAKLYSVILQDAHAWTPLIRFNSCHTMLQYMLDTSTLFHALICLPPILQTKSWWVKSNFGKAENEVISTQSNCMNWCSWSLQIPPSLALTFLSSICHYMTESYFKMFFRPWYVHQMYRNWRTDTPFHDSRYLLSPPWLRCSL